MSISRRGFGYRGWSIWWRGQHGLYLQLAMSLAGFYFLVCKEFRRYGGLKQVFEMTRREWLIADEVDRISNGLFPDIFSFSRPNRSFLARAVIHG